MIIGISGLIGSGKNTVSDYLVSQYNFKQLSFASTLKDVCSILFQWDRDALEGDTPDSRVWRETVDPWWSKKLNIPNFSPRFALQNIGTDIMRKQFNDDIWVLSMESKLSQYENVVVSDVRFKNEFNMLKQNGASLMLVTRGALPEWYHHALYCHNTGDYSTFTHNHPEIHLSEYELVGSEFDYVINNDRSVEELYRHIESIFVT